MTYIHLSIGVHRRHFGDVIFLLKMYPKKVFLLKEKKTILSDFLFCAYNF